MASYWLVRQVMHITAASPISPGDFGLELAGGAPLSDAGHTETVAAAGQDTEPTRTQLLL